VWRVDGQQWTTLHELLALNVEAIHQWGHLHARANWKGLPDPLRVPRPGEQIEQTVESKSDRVVTDPREIAKFFG